MHVEKEIDFDNIDNLMDIKALLGDGTIALPSFAHAVPGDKVCLVTHDESSILIVPVEEIKEEISRLKEPLNYKNVSEEAKEIVESRVNAVIGSILSVTTVNEKGCIKLGGISNIMDDTGQRSLCFRNVCGKLIMYLGKQALLQSFNTTSYKL